MKQSIIKFFKDNGFQFIERSDSNYFYYRNKHDSDIVVTIVDDTHFDIDVYDELDQKTVVKLESVTFKKVKKVLGLQ